MPDPELPFGAQLQLGWMTLEATAWHTDGMDVNILGGRRAQVFIEATLEIHSDDGA